MGELILGTHINTTICGCSSPFHTVGPICICPIYISPHALIISRCPCEYCANSSFFPFFLPSFLFLSLLPSFSLLILSLVHSLLCSSLILKKYHSHWQIFESGSKMLSRIIAPSRGTGREDWARYGWRRSLSRKLSVGWRLKLRGLSHLKTRSSSPGRGNSTCKDLMMRSRQTHQEVNKCDSEFGAWFIGTDVRGWAEIFRIWKLWHLDLTVSLVYRSLTNPVNGVKNKQTYYGWSREDMK